MVAVQIICLDYYFKKVQNNIQLPVIRVFGPNHNGQKTLVHLHGVLPYLYFRPLGNDERSFSTESQVRSYLDCFHQKIEDELHKVKRTNAMTSPNSIYKLEICSKLSLYGYADKCMFFVKVLVYNPADVKYICNILESGLLGIVMQPFESHVPYLLQFTNDFNVLPMNWLELDDNIEYRSIKIDSKISSLNWIFTDQSENFISNNNNNMNYFNSTKCKIPKSSISVCEIDASVVCIKNCDFPQSRFGYDIWEEEIHRRVALDMLPIELPVQTFSENYQPSNNAVNADFDSRIHNLIDKGELMSRSCDVNIDKSFQDSQSKLLTQLFSNPSDDYKFDEVASPRSRSTSLSSSLSESFEENEFIESSTQRSCYKEILRQKSENKEICDILSYSQDVLESSEAPPSETKLTQSYNQIESNSKPSMRHVFKTSRKHHPIQTDKSIRFALNKPVVAVGVFYLGMKKRMSNTIVNIEKYNIPLLANLQIDEFPKLIEFQSEFVQNSSESILGFFISAVGSDNTMFQNYKRWFFMASKPPTNSSLTLKKEMKRSNYTSQVATPTPSNTVNISPDMKVQEELSGAARLSKYKSRITILSLEVHACSRGCLLPNPKYDAIEFVAWNVIDKYSDAQSEHCMSSCGFIAQCSDTSKCRLLQKSFRDIIPSDNYRVDIVSNEIDVFEVLRELFEIIDPDIIVGYEIEKNSLGYLIQRALCYDINLCQSLSRVPMEKTAYFCSNNIVDENELDSEHESNIYIVGRIVLNMWRRMRSELKLMSYTIQSVSSNVLHSTFPDFSNEQLTRWYRSNSSSDIKSSVITTIRYFHNMSKINILLLEKLDLVRRYAESARLYGIDFFSVISRGSQYRVEAVLLRKAHQLGYIAISPCRQQVANQAAMAVIPLVMEPKSSFYQDPIIVLDYQSLYPSMIIAYNLCYTTCMGKLRPGSGGDCNTTQRLGVVNYPETLTSKYVYDHCVRNQKPFVAPNGSIFCAKDVKHGILPLMLKEILDTRLMVKQSIKDYNTNERKIQGMNILNQVLDARQLAIKLLANVTYGYAAAGFSGRMPMAELADAIVQSGRSLLEWTIKEINENGFWGGEVVYGDTDSVFVRVPGKSKDDAFRIGIEIANAITAKLPENVVLKFEKVYDGSILLSKKRYVGNCFESLSQKHSHLDAKGIEVIRRDQCALTQKVQEKVLRLLFQTRNLSQVKSYLESAWTKVLSNSNSLQDFIFLKEVRYGHYRDNNNISSLPPGAVIVEKAIKEDPMAIVPHKMKVPYVVVNGPPRSNLYELVVRPYDVLRRGSNLRINVMYYLEKCVNPSLARILNLCGVDVHGWFANLHRPKSNRVHHSIRYDEFDTKSSTVKSHKMKQQCMDVFAFSVLCCVCYEKQVQPRSATCDSCRNMKAQVVTIFVEQYNSAINKEKKLEEICRICSHSFQQSMIFAKNEMIGENCCQSLDCKLFYARSKNVVKVETSLMTLQTLE